MEQILLLQLEDTSLADRRAALSWFASVCFFFPAKESKEKALTAWTGWR